MSKLIALLGLESEETTLQLLPELQANGQVGAYDVSTGVAHTVNSTNMDRAIDAGKVELDEENLTIKFPTEISWDSNGVTMLTHQDKEDNTASLKSGVAEAYKASKK